MIWIQSQQIAVPTWTAEEWILHSALGLCSWSAHAVSTCRAMEQIIHNPGVNIILYLVLPACCSGSSRFCACTALSGLRGRPTGPDGSHLVLMPLPSLGGGGRRGGPVGSFAPTPFFAAASCSSSCAYPQKHAVGPFYTLLENRLSAPVIDNYTHY